MNSRSDHLSVEVFHIRRRATAGTVYRTRIRRIYDAELLDMKLYDYSQSSQIVWLAGNQLQSNFGYCEPDYLDYAATAR